MLPKATARPDRPTVIASSLAAGSILLGILLEGGKITDVLQLNAALIVMGGTVGAMMVNHPPLVCWRALKKLARVFVVQPPPIAGLLEQIIRYLTDVRKNGILTLEYEVDRIADPFLRKALSLAVDGVEPKQIREYMELEILLEERRLDMDAGIFESAGGYAPTIGIIGAVLGLIQVMKHLDNIQDVGHGIAVAFVSTVYGVGLANLILLPAAGRLRSVAAQQIELRQLVVEGVIGISERQNPRLIRSKLEAFLPGDSPALPVEPLIGRFVMKAGAGK